MTSNQRRVAKTVNFGVIYGIKPFGLASRLGITQAEAAAFIDAYFDEYAGRRRLHDEDARIRARRPAASRRSSAAAGRSTGSRTRRAGTSTWPSGRPSTP